MNKRWMERCDAELVHDMIFNVMHQVQEAAGIVRAVSPESVLECYDIEELMETLWRADHTSKELSFIKRRINNILGRKDD